MGKLTTSVVSVCFRPHSKVWRLTSNLLPKFVPADRYTVFVPDDDVTLFKEVSPPFFEVVSQSQLDRNYAVGLEDALRNAGNLERLGWYRQQFHKLSAIREQESERVVIWDADCVPLRHISAFDAGGEPRYMQAMEYH